MLTFHPSPLSATKPPHCTSSPFCSPGAIRPPLWPSTTPVGSHSNASVTPQRHSPNGRALCHRHLVLGAQHCLPCTCQSETGAARHPQWGGTRSASSWAQGQTHQENTCSAQANVSPQQRAPLCAAHPACRTKAGSERPCWDQAANHRWVPWRSSSSGISTAVQHTHSAGQRWLHTHQPSRHQEGLCSKTKC